MESGAQSAGDGLRIGAGVLHYRYWPDVQTTIDALLAQSRPPDEIVLVDHASGDGSAAKLREAYPQLEVVETQDNRGPSAGMNRLMTALLAKDVDAVLTLTDDMDLARDGLELLAARLAEDAGLGAVGPLVAHQRAPELIFYAGGYVDRRNWALEFREQPSQLSDWEGKPPQEVDFLEFGGILLRASAVQSGPMLPEHFYYHLDDVDYTLRLRARGWKLACIPAAVAWQDLGDRSQETILPPPDPYLITRNRLALIARNAPRRMLAREFLRVFKWLARDAIRPRSGSRAELKPRLRGLIDFCRGRWGPPPAKA